MPERPETIDFNGVTYRLMGGRRRYYLSQSKSNEGRRHAKGLHVAIWEFYSGQSVQKGWEIHHKDHDSFNNAYENLECIIRGAHRAHHPLHDPEKQRRHLAKIRPLTVAWHRSPEGRAWHSQNAIKSAAARKLARQA